MITESVDVVISPVRLDQLDGQPGPLGALLSKQSPDERHVGGDLVSVHPGCAHRGHHPGAVPFRSIEF